MGYSRSSAALIDHLLSLCPSVAVSVLQTGDMRRIIPRQKLSWLYRFQHIYLPIVYGLLTLKVRPAPTCLAPTSAFAYVTHCLPLDLLADLFTRASFY